MSQPQAEVSSAELYWLVWQKYQDHRTMGEGTDSKLNRKD